MNAPFQPRGAALRTPFSAFACDEETAATLRAVAVEFGWSPEKINLGGLRNAVQTLSVSASPNILFVDMSASGDPLGDVNALAEVCEPGTLVIAAGEINDVRLYRDLVASGIQDYLLKPLSPDALRDAFAQAQMSVSGPRVSEPGAARKHLSTAVIGVRGGVGASTVASSLAWLAAEKGGRSTALLDLDVHFGTGALSLDLEPGRGLADALENPSRIDGLFIERAMVRASDKLTVLSAEAPIQQPVMADGFAFDRLQEEIRGAFDATVIDLPRHLMIHHPRLVQDAQLVVVVADFTLAAARDCIRILSWLKATAPEAQVAIVVNKAHPGAVQEIGQKDFENSIEGKVNVVLPFDAKSAAQAAKLGQPLARVAKSPKLLQPLEQLLGIALDLGDGQAGTGEVQVNASLMGKLGGLKALLAKSPKAR